MTSPPLPAPKQRFLAFFRTQDLQAGHAVPAPSPGGGTSSATLVRGFGLGLEGRWVTFRRFGAHLPRGHVSITLVDLTSKV